MLEGSAMYNSSTKGVLRKKRYNGYSAWGFAQNRGHRKLSHAQCLNTFVDDIVRVEDYYPAR